MVQLFRKPTLAEGLKKGRAKKKREEEAREKRAERIRKRGAELLRKQREEEYALARTEREIQLAKARGELAEERAKKKRAEAEVWEARRKKVGVILRPPKIGLGRKEVSTKKVRKVAKTGVRGVAKGFKGAREWARGERDILGRKTKKTAPKKKVSVKKTTAKKRTAKSPSKRK